MKILSKENLKLFQFPDNKISNNQKVISGIKKNVTQAFILSVGNNDTTGEPFVDVRLWAISNKTEEYVPTPKGLRLTMDQYASFCTMLQDEFPAISNSTPEIKVVSIEELLNDEEEIVNPFSKQAQQQREENLKESNNQPTIT